MIEGTLWAITVDMRRSCQLGRVHSDLEVTILEGTTSYIEVEGSGTSDFCRPEQNTTTTEIPAKGQETVLLVFATRSCRQVS